MTGPTPPAPALAEVLASVRLQSSVMSRAELRSPWAVRSRALSRAIFHAVVEGELELSAQGEPAPVRLRPGDVVMLPRGVAHVLSDGSDALAASMGQLPLHDDGTCVQTLRYGGQGAQARIICGTFELKHAASDVMLASLPELLHARGTASGGVGAWLDTTVTMLAEQLDRRAPGADAVVARLTDVLVMHVLSRTVDQAPARGGGWFSALRDKRIGRAIATMHQDPAGNWTASNLASAAGMSRSSFFARFSELVGEPPARYLARWRVWVAADLIEREGLSGGELAGRVGYTSEDAFSRVFKRIMGMSPVQFRRQAVAS